MPPASPRVFISYSHDSRAHCGQVLALAQQLRRDGISAELDQFHENEPLHWPRWCEEQMRPENADFVLCVCTAEYARRVEGRVPADVGKGVFWEGTLIYSELYDAKGNPRCVPVLLVGAKDTDIPRVLKNQTWRRLDRLGLDDPESGYAKLYRLLTRQPGVQAEAVGAPARLPPLPEAQPKTDFMALIGQIHAEQLDHERKSKRRHWLLVALTLMVLAGLAAAVWQTQSLRQQTQRQAQQQQEANADTRAKLEEIIAATRQPTGPRDNLSPEQRYAQALQEVAAKHQLKPDELRAAIDAWTHKVKTDPQASPYDLALAEYKASHFEQAAAQAGKAYDQAMQVRDAARQAEGKATGEAIKAARLEGDAYAAQGHYELALAAYRKSAALTDKDKEPLAWAGEQEKVSTMLWLLARYQEAEPLMREIFILREQQQGTDHTDTAAALNNLALLLQDTNRLAEAEPLMRRVLAIAEKSHGPEHPNVATVLNNLALLLQDTNRLAEAEPLMRRALAINEKSYGPEHPDVARDLNNLARLLQATHRLTEAEPLYRRALAIDEKSFGTEHPKVAIRLNNLATLLQDTNRLAEAEPLMRRALAIDEKSFGAEHPNVAISLNNLATLMYATHQLAEAEPLMRRHLVIFLKFTRATGHEYPNLRDAVGNYRRLLQALHLPTAQIQTRLAQAAQAAGYTAAQWAERQAAWEQVRVEAIVPGSQAERLGLQPGDVIARYAGEKITSNAQLIEKVGKTQAPAIPLIILRAGKPVTLTAQPGKLGVRLQ